MNMFKMILASVVAMGMSSFAFAQDEGGAGEAPKAEATAPAAETTTTTTTHEKHAMKKDHGKKMMKKGNNLADDLKEKFSEIVDRMEDKFHGILK